jgi:hypothetical protein|nr:MAG TPA: hypothetical protein [Herelleviridae sp.]
MLKLTENQKNDELIKSLLDSGFSEETIAGWINSGDITLKSEEPEGDGDDKEPDDVPSDPEGDGDDPEEGSEDDKKKSKGCDGDGKEGEGADPEPPIAKSFDSEELMKSLASVLDERDDLLKSMVADSFKDVLAKVDGLVKSIDGLVGKIDALGDQAPAFKSAGLNRAVLEKSIGGGVKDDNDKTVLSVSRDRTVVRALIEKAIDEEKDEAIQKSLRDETLNYLIDPVGGAIGETAARYMYNNKNVRLVK